MVTKLHKKLDQVEPSSSSSSDPAGGEPETSFADLLADAGGIDAGQGGPIAAPLAPPPDPAEQMARELFALLKLPRNLAAKRFAWWPDFPAVWSDDQLRAIAESFAALSVHMGWSMDDLMGKFGPWLAVAVAAGMPAYLTWDAVQDRRQQLAAAARAAQKNATSAQHGDPQQQQPA